MLDKVALVCGKHLEFRKRASSYFGVFANKKKSENPLSPAWFGHVQCQVFFLRQVSPLYSIVDTRFVWVTKLVELDVVLYEGVRQHPEHEQHQRLCRTMNHRTYAPKNHHADLPGAGKMKLQGKSTIKHI